jgi:hypothetical protein
MLIDPHVDLDKLIVQDLVRRLAELEVQRER